MEYQWRQGGAKDPLKICEWDQFKLSDLPRSQAWGV